MLLIVCTAISHSFFSSTLKNNDYISKMLMLKTVTDEYIDTHYGTDRAQYERVTALALMKGGNIDLSTISVRNVKSKLEPDKKMIVFKFKCLSKERGIVHTGYMVFENKEGGEYIQSPCSYCTCENGVLFCSHMICFLYIMGGIQKCWNRKTRQQIQDTMPDNRRVIQSLPCLIEMVLAPGKIKRQMAQSNRQAKKRKQN